MKIESRRGPRLWFYERLVPWKNYVPAAPEMGYLVDKVRWLSRQDAMVQEIGEAGRELAEQLTYAREIENAMPVISAAFRYFAGK